MEHVRTCLGCRQRVDKSSLLRVVARSGEVVPDASATLPGRGAWVHPTPACVEKSISRKAFGRALRITTSLDARAVLITVEESSGALHTEVIIHQADIQETAD